MRNKADFVAHSRGGFGEKRLREVRGAAMKETAYDKSLTIADIAEALGVSKTTVSRAISGKGRIGEATRRKVLDYINAHDYKPNVIAQSLAQSKTFNICAVMPGNYDMMDMPFFRNSLMGVVEVVSAGGYDVIVTVSDEKDISNLERVISNHKVDGVVLLRAIVDDPAVSYLKERGVPFVVLGSVPDEGVVQVDSNHREACREMTSVLLMKGMRRIALIGGNETHIVTQSRLAGFQDAYRDMKIPLQKDLIYQNVENSVMAEKAVNEVLAKDIDGIMCMDDAICNYILQKFDRDGTKVPEDVRIASFYSSNMLENHIPSITSLKFDVKELGMVCGRILLEQIEGGTVKQSTILGYEVVLKESTK